MDSVMEPPKDPLSTRYSLLSRLQNWNDGDSWKDFFDTYWRLIYSVAMRAGLSEAEAQDVIQETIVSVAKNIHKFKRDKSLGSFKSWLRNIIRWRIADQFKKRLPVEVETDEDSLIDIPDSAADTLEAAWDEEWQTNLMNAALDRIKLRVKEEHYLMFDMYVVRRLPASEIARTLGVTIGQIYLAKHRVSALLKKEIRALEEDPI